MNGLSAHHDRRWPVSEDHLPRVASVHHIDVDQDVDLQCMCEYSAASGARQRSSRKCTYAHAASAL